MRSIKNLESSRDDKKRALSCTEKKGPKRRASSLSFLPPAPAAVRPALEGKKNGERKSRWILSPIPNTHSYLLIERSSSNTGLFLFLFFLEFLISKAAYHKHPTPYDLLGGRSPFESNKVSSRGFIATFILKESEEPTFSQ
jgi:hypothetical protein